MTLIFKGNCKKCGFISEDKTLYKTKGNCKKCSNEWHRKNMEGKYVKVGRPKTIGLYQHTFWRDVFLVEMPINCCL